MPASVIFNLTPREKMFVLLNATSLTYEQIARLMFVELKTVHTYYDRVAKKMHAGSRQALTLLSLQHGLAKLASYPVSENGLFNTRQIPSETKSGRS
ncbi:LuxR C-terminal-related transcriptional regulator [Sediminibacterium soli]|uniref:LuxR C-terminal-related transcriptional regulator n=1 Tax=Sediminibacterium soli TaxID=2698829 RepID=UPI00137A67B0|nr:hypothetical protein [Sediminibacterium soli]